ncbi:hypothetical protein ZYGR_0H04470 [Zygosaccharomyces rouxii]|uniref:ZYRO0B14300p n=2 Tax=Zygosaccharomyces rouxii TaxID=4956 RepID=C5DS68_ZYGRC|nr:uncharacterized protein ZYRO0B14300g [Zygosaccharomyces rouxii]KAH9199842.1 hypothetical protein LQ764DRAFT_108911 [Zygosaccharomyces rouxii]GAV47601.1 hypothetical protein ZYGR_0H04470 [Zygosaccharomyces rouxii]CAR26629.1 ZYRO0B14300p [Zygosaccharomyces rouxii]
MQISRFRKGIMKPFENLTALESLVQWLRLISSTLIIALGIVVTVGPLTSPNALRVAQFDTRPADITKGLFEALKHAVEVFGSTDVNNGVGMTTSEIFILTEYTEGQIQNIPQFITLNLYGRCDISYETKDIEGPKGITQVRNSTISQSCHRTGPGFIFDYRSVLLQLGLDIVLDYAYDKSGSSSESNSYNEYMSSIRHRKGEMVNLLYAVISLEICILVMTFWYYIIKGRFINPFKERLLMHSISLLSFTVFICSLTSIITLTCINYNLRDRVRNELKAFGFSYSLGTSWLMSMWFMAVFVIVSTLVWSGLEWCISDSQDYGDETQNNILSYEPGVFMDESELRDSNDGFEDGEMYRSNNITSETNAVRRSVDGYESDCAEELELQDLALYSSEDSGLMMQRTVKPSSTMQF